MTTEIPIIQVGRYAGTPIDKLPNGYLRWMMLQDFPKEWLEIAQRKLENSDHNDTYLFVSRHAIDMYSKRFLGTWLMKEASKDGDGLATFIVKQAQEAWGKGVDVSKNRHKDDGIVKELDGVRYVFGINTDFPDYKEVITIYPSE